jgi:putative transposase
MAATAAREQYKTDLTDSQWHLIEPHLPPAQPGGRPREVDLREVVNTVLYLTGHWRKI